MSCVASRPQKQDESIPAAGHEIPGPLHGTTDIINDAQREFADMAPSMLKKNVVAMVFLPWLTKYTGRLIRSAKEEERRAILAALPSDADVANKDPHFLRGRNEALKQMRDVIQARSEPALPIELV